MAVEEMLYKLVQEFKDTAKTKTIVGEPIVVAGKTIIPVSKVTLGFGGGYGEDPQEKSGGGAGAAGGVSVSPVALIVIDEAGVSVSSLSRGFGFDKIVELVPELIDKVSEAAKDHKPSKKDEE
ncbi:MAG: sporulation protein [Chloroflexi bacterium]|nr:sporulation protein [Chloroflexota bacterium]MBU1750751.1 sporulation protein [Chloroflexota bacterium]MBU1877421.1 sporulation protein [Chloroflexota bacterium]